MVCTVEMVSVKGLRVTAGISGEDWPGQHCNLLSLKSAVNCGPAMKGSGNGVTVSTGNVLIFKKERRQECYFQIRRQSFAIFGSVLLKSS